MGEDMLRIGLALGIAVVIVLVTAGVVLRVAWEVLDWPLSISPSQAYLSQARVDLYDCPDFTYQEDAQAVYDQETSDPYGLDSPRREKPTRG